MIYYLFISTRFFDIAYLQNNYNMISASVTLTRVY
jgi:hypothetical protein